MKILKILIEPRTLIRIICFASVSFFLVHSFKWSLRLEGGFMDYYTYSRVLIDHDEFDQVYDYQFFKTKLASLTSEHIDGFPNQLPTNAFALFPLAYLKPTTARFIWNIISILCLGLSLKILLRLFGISLFDDLGMAIVSIACLMRAQYVNNTYGQIFNIILLLFCLSLLALTKRIQFAAAIPITFSFLFKGFGVVSLLWLAVTKHWKAFISTILLIIAALIISLPLFGIQTYINYYIGVVSTLGKVPPDAHTYFQTINSLLNHLFSYDKNWLPSPFIVLPKSVVTMVSYLFNLIVIGFVIKASYAASKEMTILSYSAALAAGVVTSPLAPEYYYILFLPLIIGLFVYLLKEYEGSHQISAMHIVFFISLAVMIFQFNYVKWNLLPSLIILLAYPKLYAGIMMLMIFKWVVKKDTLLQRVTAH